MSGRSFRLAGGSAALVVGLMVGSAALAWHGPDPVTVVPKGQPRTGIQLATNEAGQALAAWRQNEEGAWLLYAAIRSGGTWTSPSMVADGEIVEIAADLGAHGTAALIWQVWDGSESRVQASVRAPGGAWEGAQTLSLPGEAAFHPRIVVDETGNLLAAWASSGGVSASFRPAGGAWSSAAVLSGPGALRPSVSLSSGQAAAVWLESDGLHWRARAATAPFGGAWTVGPRLSAPGAEASAPDVAADASGSAIAVWTLGRSPESVPQLAERPAGGSWQRARDLAPVTGPGRNVDVTIGPGGHTLVFWVSSGDLVLQLRPPGGAWGAPEFRFQRGQAEVDRAGNIVVALRWGGAVWKPFGEPWRSTFDLMPDEGGSDAPFVGVHQQGHATAVWIGLDDGVKASSFDIDSGQEQEEDEEDIEGTDEDDELFGTEGDDVFRAYGGNDKIYGRGGNDVAYGGAGNDRLYGGRGSDRLYGGAGRDALFGGAGRDWLRGGGSRDILAGERGRDFLSARDGRRDWVAGGNGLDRFRVDRKLDKLDRLELGF